MPLSAEHQRELLGKFTVVIRATVKGDLLVAALQGALGGLMFWFLEIHAPVLGAVLMAFLSLMPAVGAALVWLPVALYLLVTGSVWQGVTLIQYGALVIGSTDNILRPLLVGKDTQMPIGVRIHTLQDRTTGAHSRRRLERVHPRTGNRRDVRGPSGSSSFRPLRSCSRPPVGLAITNANPWVDRAPARSTTYPEGQVRPAEARRPALGRSVPTLRPPKAAPDGAPTCDVG
ncbi:AI-2E family transporter [Prosthecomicrobium sp. N25]|uniref:AI-2E family transporter n=1 Tax=Prosthecomicrobium sp. N25 TaxID=3129254 RepID=UPI003FCEACF2